MLIFIEQIIIITGVIGAILAPMIPWIVGAVVVLGAITIIWAKS